jgi:hypothetical protein
LERATRFLESGELDPTLLVKARFALARSLWANPSQRARAMRLAQQAAEALGTVRYASVELLREIKEWLKRR